MCLSSPHLPDNLYRDEITLKDKAPLQRYLVAFYHLTRWFQLIRLSTVHPGQETTAEAANTYVIPIVYAARRNAIVTHSEKLASADRTSYR